MPIDWSLRTLALASGLATLTAVVAYADESTDASAHSLNATLNEVIVTGSRIPVAPDAAISPVTVLDAADLARSGFNSLSTVLQSLPMSATSVLNTNVNNEGDGSARIDLRALQPKRTLVLLNGHRFPHGGIGGDESVDINSIPLALIERVEVLTAGASAIYGADAVAGVVNVITRPSYEGFEVSAQQSRTGRGDGRVDAVTVNAGHEVFGGQWMVGGEYDHQRAVNQSARGYSKAPLTIVDSQGNTVPVGSYTLPEGVFGVPEGNALGLEPNFYTRAGGSGTSAANFRPLDFTSDFYNYAPFNYLQTPNERGTLWLLGAQPLASNVSLHIEGLFHHRRSFQLLAPTPYDSTFDPARELSDGSNGIPADNYYNPFGTDVGLVYRRFVEVGDRRVQQDLDMHRELLSLRAQVGAWMIEPAVSYSRSTATKIDIGSIPAERLATALGASGPDAQGNIVCGARDASGIVPDAAILPGCVPIDVFGGVGSLTPQQIAYLTVPLKDHGTDEERIASIEAEGPWGHTPGGEIRWALGAEYRRDEGSRVFDPNRGDGVVGSGGERGLAPVSFSARELYLEFRAPFLRQRRWAEALDFSAGVRWSDFSSFGGHSTWQTAVRWEPITSVSFRATYARVFRAPSLSELFLNQVDGLNSATDPCGNQPTASQRINCAANGVPGGEYTQPPFSVFHAPQGGNPGLAPERGYSFDAGIEWRPPALTSFRATVDFYQIDLKDFIASPGPADVLQQCADGGRADICSLISRATDGSLNSVSAIPRNFGRAIVNGVDTAMSWVAAPKLGRFNLKLQTAYMGRHDSQVFPGGTTVREAGTFSTYASVLPRWRSLASVDFSRGPWHLGYNTQWIGGYSECESVFFSEDRYCRHVRQVFYHDIEAAFTVATALTLRLGVSNLFDKQPPYINEGPDANTDPSAYRLLGRTLYAGVRYDAR